MKSLECKDNALPKWCGAKAYCKCNTFSRILTFDLSKEDAEWSVNSSCTYSRGRKKGQTATQNYSVGAKLTVFPRNLKFFYRGGRHTIDVNRKDLSYLRTYPILSTSNSSLTSSRGSCKLVEVVDMEDNIL